MKLIKSIIVLFGLTLFIPKVYAFSYDMEMSVSGTSVSSGEVKEIKVILRNVQGVSGGIGACSMNIVLDGGISLQGDVSGLNNWTVMVGNIYTFDTASSFVSNMEMFKIPVKITGAGSVKLTNIGCSEGETTEKINDKSLSFTIKQNTSGNDTPSSGNVNDENPGKVDGGVTNEGKVTNIRLSEGNIEFDPETFEYIVNVKSFNNFNVYVETNGDVEYNIEKINKETEKSVVITAVVGNNVSKTYTINVIEETEDITSDEDNTTGVDEDKKFNFVPIFIGIICLLVLINIFRIVKNIRK